MYLTIEEVETGKESSQIDLPKEKLLILRTSATNERLHEELRKTGVPLENGDSGQTLENSGKDKKTDEKDENRLKPTPKFNRPVKVSGLELLGAIQEGAGRNKIKSGFIGIRSQLKTRGKDSWTTYITKIYFASKLSNKNGSKEFKFKKFPKVLSEDLLRASFYLQCWEYQDRLVFAINRRKPGHKPTHRVVFHK